MYFREFDIQSENFRQCIRMSTEKVPGKSIFEYYFLSLSKIAHFHSLLSFIDLILLSHTNISYNDIL